MYLRVKVNRYNFIILFFYTQVEKYRIVNFLLIFGIKVVIK